MGAMIHDVVSGDKWRSWDFNLGIYDKVINSSYQTSIRMFK